MLDQVLQSNAHLGRKQEIIDLLLNKPDPMPQNVIDQLITASQQTNILDELEASMAYHSARWSFALNQVIDYYSADTISYDDSLLVWLAKVPRYGYYLSKALYYETIGNRSQAVTLLSTAGQNISLSQYESDQVSDLYGFIDDYNTQFTSSNPWDFSGGFGTLCTSVGADPESKAGSYARNLQRFAAQNTYEVEDPSALSAYEPGKQLPDATANKNLPVINQVLSAPREPDNCAISVFPNPASSHITFKWTHLPLEKETWITICTIDGRVAYKGKIELAEDEFKLNTINFSQGKYIYNISDRDNVYHSGIISIVH